MLSTEQCRSFLKEKSQNEQAVEVLRDNLYNLANILVDEYLSKSKCKNEGACK